MKKSKIFTYKIIVFDYNSDGPEQEISVEEFSSPNDEEAKEHFDTVKKKAREKNNIFLDDIDDMELYRIDVPEQRTHIDI